MEKIAEGGRGVKRKGTFQLTDLPKDWAKMRKSGKSTVPFWLKSRMACGLPKDWAKMRKSGKSIMPLPLMSAWGMDVTGGCSTVMGVMATWKGSALLMNVMLPERLPGVSAVKTTSNFCEVPGATVMGKLGAVKLPKLA